MTTLIEVSGLCKQYTSSFGKAKITALDGIDFTVGEGELFGLLGPNGAGKNTTVKILLGLTRATSGSVSIDGKPVGDPESRRHVGYLPEGHKIPNYLTARQALSIFGRMSGMAKSDIERKIPELLERVRLTDWADVRTAAADLARRVATEVATEGRPAARVAVTVRFAPFTTRSRSLTLAEPTADGTAIETAALDLLERFTTRRAVRLIGVRAEFASE